jgi:signal transduction histidine kinase/PAS domain-containing protein
MQGAPQNTQAHYGDDPTPLLERLTPGIGLRRSSSQGVPLWREAVFLRYTVAFLMVELAILGRMVLDPVLGFQAPHATFFLAVVISAALGGWQSALVAMVSSEIAANWFFRETHHLFPTGVAQWIGSGSFIVGAGVTILFIESFRSAQYRAEAALARLRKEVSELKQVEGARCQLLLELAEERVRLGTVLQQSPIGVVIAESPSGKTLFGNAEAARLLRRPSLSAFCPDDPTTGPWRALHGDGRPYEPNEWPLARAIANGEVVKNEEIQLEFSDGAFVYVSVNAAPVEDCERHIAAGIMTLQDITTMKRAQARLGAFSLLGQGLNSVQTTLEAARIIADITQDLFGWDAFSLSLCELDGHSFERVLQIDTIDGRRHEVEPRTESEIPQRMVPILKGEAELILKTEPLTLLSDCVPFCDRSRPSASLMYVPFRDQGSGLGVLSIQSYQFQAYDDADLKMLQSLADYCGGALRRIRMETALAQSNDRNRHLFEAVNRQKLQLEEQVAERREAEEEIHRLNADLEMRVRERTRELEAANEELEAFCFSVSHDLRAPLRSIAGFTQALAEDCGHSLPPEGKQSLDLVIQSTIEMDQLIDDLLGLSRLSRGDMVRTRVDLSSVAREIAGSLQRRDPNRVVEWVIATELSARADGRLLRIAIENLLGNAWKFTGKRERARIEFGVECRPDGPVYFVRDNGAGFDMNYAGKLFQAFQRLHTTAEFPGHGIGLATVQRIIHRHGGRVWAESEVNHGATFYFSLPEK